jgi:hypothetical protein
MYDAFASHMDSELQLLLGPSIQNKMAQYSKLCNMLDKSVDTDDVSKSEVNLCKLD